jgi:hypothetical protein
MASKVFLLGDEDAIWLAAAADVVLDAIEAGRASGAAFIRLTMVSAARDEAGRPAYFDPQRVSAILPVDARELDYARDNPPDWLS